MNQEKLIGYIKGEITSELEILEILNWIESSPENQNSYNQLKSLWVVSGLDHPDQLVIPPFPYPKAKRQLFSEVVLRSFMKYAAIFILAFILGSLSLYLIDKGERNQLSSLYNTIEVSYGQRSQIILYDGTKVWLNSGTIFKYPVTFSHNTGDV